jgi:putative copper export protein
MSTILGLIHGADYILSYWVIGGTIFYGFISSVSPEARMIGSDWPKKMRTLLALTFVSSFCWLLFTSSDMAGSWRPADLWTAINQTHFGHMWCLRLALILLLVFTVRWASANRVTSLIFLGLILLLPLPSALTGHAGAQNHALFFHVAIDLSHSIAVSIWTGGLWFLYSWLGKRLTTKVARPNISFRVVKRFSHFAMASTGVIALSGLAMAYMAGVSWRHPWASTYGTLITVKIFFFSAALLAAAINQFIHLRIWNPNYELKFARNIRREVGLELIFVLLVFFLAGFLARTPMPNG